MRIYADLVAMLNFLIDFLLFLGTNRLSGDPPGWKRAIPAAALGGIYSGTCLMPGLGFLAGGTWRLVFLALICTMAFGLGTGSWRRWGLFLLLSMALGGMALLMESGGIRLPLLAAVGLWLLCRLGFGGKPGSREYLPLEIRHGAITVRLTALRDSGNGLKDPLTGEQVLVIGPDAAERLTGLHPSQLRNPLETMGKGIIRGLRLVPYHTVGQGGMLLAMRFQDVTIGNRKTSAVVAFAPERIGRGEGYQALTGGAI